MASNIRRVMNTQMTRKEWLAYFEQMKNETEPSGLAYMPVDQYRPDDYAGFINDILNYIRAGREEYCFKLGHIEDLLKYEHERLVAVWLPDDQCFKVSLRKEKKSNPKK